MKIWIDTLSLLQVADHDTNECDDDCANDCNSDYNFYNPPRIQFAEDNFLIIQNTTFHLPSQLYIQQYDNERWLVCNPIGEGSIAVLDEQALLLLEHFRTPTQLVALQSRLEHPLADLEQAVTLFHQLGFLKSTDQSLPAFEPAQPQTLSAWLHITNACNLRCPYCYLHKTSEHMADDTSRKAIDAIFRSATRNNFQRVLLKYAGGEASLHAAHVLAVHDYATEQAQQHNIQFYAYIISNGVNLSQRIIDQFKVRGIGVTISLDGIGEYHDVQRPFLNGQGSFKYVDRTISRLLASDLIPHINVTVSQRNLDGLPALMHYILEREMSFTLSYYRENECSESMRDLQFADERMIAAMRVAFDVIEHDLPRRRLIGSLIDKASMNGPHQHACSAGRNYLVIDQDGGIAKCHSAIKQTITTINDHDPLQAIRNDKTGMQNLAVEEKEGCRTCEWRYWCAGGCPLVTYKVTGRNDVKSPNCNIYKALFPAALRLEALRLLKYTTPVTLEDARIVTHALI
jgi:uncharacterized protein